jgi:hypothetical protein
MADANNVFVLAPARRVNHLRARYAFVRNPAREFRNDHHELCWALYDIVDNAAGHERVLAYAVRHEPALEIVSALNAMEEAKRVAAAD